MSANLRELMETAAARPSRPVDAERVWRRGRRRLWARRATSAVVAASLLVGAWAVSDFDVFSAHDVQPAHVGDVARLDVPPGNVIVTRDRVWVADVSELYSVDPATGRVDATVLGLPIRSDMGIAVGAGAVWTFGWTGSPTDTATARGDIVRVDLERLESLTAAGDATIDFDDVGARVDLPGDHAPYAGAYGHGSLWVADAANEYLLRVDGDDPSTKTRIPVGGAPKDVALYNGSVWVLRDHRRGGDLPPPTMVEIDPRTNDIVGRPVPIGACANRVAGGEGAIWVSDFCTGRVMRVDPGRHAVEASVDVGRSAGPIAVGKGAVWTTVDNADPNAAGHVARIDPVTMETTDVAVPTQSVGSHQGLAAGHRALWVAGTTRVLRVELEP